MSGIDRVDGGAVEWAKYEDIIIGGVGPKSVEAWISGHLRVRAGLVGMKLYSTGSNRMLMNGGK
jgi:hypothetical protein